MQIIKIILFLISGIALLIGAVTYRKRAVQKGEKELSVYTFLIILGGFLFIASVMIFIINPNGTKTTSTHEQKIEQPEEEIQNFMSSTCSICGNQFEGNGYEEVSSGVWRLLKDPYSGTICSVTCGMKHTKKINDIANSYGVDLRESKSNNQNNNDYEMRDDGKVYETNACSMCKGTGVQKGRNYLSGEIEYLTCQMCEGQGVRSY